MNYLLRILFKSQFAVLLTFGTACLKEHDIDLTNINQDSIVNEWIYNTMYNYYYWNEHLPTNLVYSQSPQSFFQSILYNQGTDDRFSWISDNAEENYNMLHGVNKEFGFEYMLTYSDTTKNDLVGVILYVKSNTPAEKAGIKRGDIFSSINGNTLTLNNIEQLLSLDNATFIINSDRQKDTISLTTETVNVNPIQLSKILGIDNQKIGYIVYNQFIEDKGDGTNQYTNELLNVFEGFKKERITDIIIDLRYNPGGQVESAVILSSLITPNIDTTKTALKIEYNNKIMQCYEEKMTTFCFKAYPSAYIGNDLNHIVFITSGQTASASEALINILKAYTKVTIIGTTTYGKNVGSTMFTDNITHSNWAIQPIILKLYNAKHESNYAHGFEPDISINELNYKLIPLGDINEPLLRKAISVITNKTDQTILKSQKISQVYNSIQNKNNLPLIIKTTTQ